MKKNTLIFLNWPCSFSNAIMIVTVLFSFGSLHGQTKSLLSFPGDWHDPLTWFPNGVPTDSDSVFIHGPAFISPDSMAVAKHIFISNGGQLDIQKSGEKFGRILIKNISGDGIINNGLINNSGRIALRDISTPIATDNQGLLNNGVIVNNELARIICRSIDDIAINNKGRIYNSGLISISEKTTDAIGFVSNGYLENQSTGTIEIYDLPIFPTEGLLIGIGDTLINDGLINIYNMKDGILNDGVIINNDSIWISQIKSGSGIVNSGIFKNTITGSITIDTVTNPENSIYCYSLFNDFRPGTTFINDGYITVSNGGTFRGLYNGSLLDNNGFILIKNHEGDALYNQGSLFNSGQIWIDSSSTTSAILNIGNMINENGAKIFSYGKIFNYTGSIENDGQLYVISISQLKHLGLNNGARIVNRDSIYILNTSHGINSSDTLINTLTGYISIQSDGNSSSISLSNGSYLLNDGELKINIQNDVSIEAVFNNSDGNLINNGSISIDYLPGDDIIYLNGMTNRGVITNNGELTIDNFDKALTNVGPNSDNYSDSTGEFYNNGFLKIYRSKSYGIQNGGIFIGSVGSELLLSNSGAEYPVLDILFDSTFELYGELDILLDGN